MTFGCLFDTTRRKSVLFLNDENPEVAKSEIYIFTQTKNKLSLKMKKNIITLAIAAIAMLPVTANAHRADNGRDAQSGRQARTERQAKARNFCFVDSARAFQGITLTEKQSAEIAKINAETRAEMQTRRQQAQANCKQQNCNAANCTAPDCNAANCDNKATRDKARAERREQARQYKLDYLHKIKNVLSESQYVTFLENTVTAGGRQGVQNCKFGKFDKRNKGNKATRHNRRHDNRHGCQNAINCQATQSGK